MTALPHILRAAVIAGLFAGTAHAQEVLDLSEPDPAPEGETQDVLDLSEPDPEPQNVLAYRGTFREGGYWKAVDIGQTAILEVVASPDNPDVLVAIGLDGVVRVSMNRGQRWFEVYDGQAAGSVNLLTQPGQNVIPASLKGLLLEREALGLQAQAVVEEINSLPEDDFEAADEREELFGLYQDLQRDIQALDTQIVAEQQAFFQAAARRFEAPQVFFTGPTGIMVAHANGILVSENLGETWRETLEGVRVYTVVQSDRGSWWAGTEDGVRESNDLQSWSPPQDGTQGLQVRVLERAGDRWLAGTSRGLRSSFGDGLWNSWGDFEGRVLAFEQDPQMPGRMWVSTPNTIFRSDTRGRILEAPTGAPIRWARDLYKVPGGPLLVASTEDGLLESTTEGVSFAPLGRAANIQRAFTLSVAPAGVWVGAASGLFTWVESAQDTVGIVRAVKEDWLDIGVVRQASQAVEAQVMGRSSKVMRNSVLGRLLPILRLYAYQHYNANRYSTLGGSLFEGPDRRSSVYLQASWPLGGRTAFEVDPTLDATSSLGIDSSGVIDAARALENYDVYVSFAGDGAQLSGVGGRAGRRGLKQLMSRDQQLTELIYSREVLLYEQQAGGSLGLIDKVQQQLRIDETEAWLNIYSAGAVARLRLAKTEETQ